MDIPALRALLRPFIGDLKDNCTNASMPDYCAELGLPAPGDEEGSKRDRMHSAVDALPDDKVPSFAQGLVGRRLMPSNLRNQVQDLLWADSPVIEIPKRSRRELARTLQSLDLFHRWESFSQLLQDVFVIPSTLSAIFLGPGGDVLGYVHQHFVRNPEDADVERLFEDLHVFDLSDKRFGLFLGMV